MTLTDQNIQKFLGGKQVVVLATVQADGAPLAMPMWFLHDLGSLTMISVEGLAERFHAKYPGLARLWGGRAMPANRVMFRITPARVRSWGLESVRDD